MVDILNSELEADIMSTVTDQAQGMYGDTVTSYAIQGVFK